jgi:hypothetical protein
VLPFDIDEVRIEPSKHFRNLRMRKRDWDVHDLREALRQPVRVIARGSLKMEVWVRKGGSKKLVLCYYREERLVLVLREPRGD